MSAPEWIRLVAIEECALGRAKFVQVNGRNLAVFHLPDPDRFVATADECPHAGASLSSGEVRGNVVTCSWHAWSFELDTGRCTCAEDVKLHRYESRVQDGYVWVKLPPAAPPSDLALPERA
jgi:nitrite reductase (NADH) small subunit